jgi:hypothetical protein
MLAAIWLVVALNGALLFKSSTRPTFAKESLKGSGFVQFVVFWDFLLTGGVLARFVM